MTTYLPNAHNSRGICNWLSSEQRPALVQGDSQAQRLGLFTMPIWRMDDSDENNASYVAGDLTYIFLQLII